MDLPRLVRSAQAGDLDAFAALVRRHQSMALAYAFALLRDLSLAQDACQEAFVGAYFALDQLDEPAAFPGWLRAVVRTHSLRLVRGRRLETAPFDAADGLADDGETPEEGAERAEVRAHVLKAVGALPPRLREVLLLHYVRGHSHREVAGFLGVPLTTVNNRLHAARRALRDHILTLVREALAAGALPEDFPRRVAREVEAWRRIPPAAGPRGFDPGAWRGLPAAPGPPAAPAFSPPLPEPGACRCRSLPWPCPRCAAAEGVGPTPPLPVAAW
jgi:RNA polymerase sigma factor (sigma-70 family)